MHLLTVGLVLRETGTLFSILLTWLCILAPKQVAKQTHRVSPLAQSLHNPSDRARVTPSPPYPNYPGSQGSWPSQELVCWGDRLLSLSVVASLGRVSGMMAAMENTSFALYANLTLTWWGGVCSAGRINCIPSAKNCASSPTRNSLPDQGAFQHILSGQ